MTSIDLGAWANELFKIGTDYLSSKLVTPNSTQPVVYQPPPVVTTPEVVYQPPPVVTTSSSDNILKIGLLAAAGVAVYMVVKK